MNTSELEHLIRDTIRKHYKLEIIGKLEVEYHVDIGYIIKFYFHQYTPTIRQFPNVDDNKLKKLVTRDLLDMNLHLMSFGTLKTIPPDFSCYPSKPCKTCNDKGETN